MNSTSVLVCIRCRATLQEHGDMLVCSRCASAYSLMQGIADFAGGRYYDNFREGDELPDAHAAGLEHEIAGAETRARFYGRLFPHAVRVLDCGCGNGRTVAHLRAAGFDAWGNDSSALRKWQWRELEVRDHLVVSDAKNLPFADGYFDAVVASGVLEHVGVDEIAIPAYKVTPRPTRDEERRAFITELLRVVAPGGRIFLDFPNGAFPIDFWHASPRRHPLDEGFLPTMPYLRKLLSPMHVKVTAISPFRRLEFRQSATLWYGRAFAPVMRAFFFTMTVPGLRWLAASRLNPFLVVRIDR